MVVKITYPFKDTPGSIQLKDIYIQTHDTDLVHQLKTTNNPVEIGIILSENEEKYKITNPQKADLHIEIADVLMDPELRKKFKP
ncbi:MULTISPECIES: hypothetical protein [unclassified Lebetimonas]|uniref:hypothetical protein n=1 Tax=unclassified Lebetimonas TaxID=2648158 RepID=UPI000465AF0A|nr:MULTISPECIES: hypothetical protein [unclassified Lebetimonas]